MVVTVKGSPSPLGFAKMAETPVKDWTSIEPVTVKGQKVDAIAVVTGSGNYPIPVDRVGGLFIKHNDGYVQLASLLNGKKVKLPVKGTMKTGKVLVHPPGAKWSIRAIEWDVVITDFEEVQ